MYNRFRNIFHSIYNCIRERICNVIPTTKSQFSPSFLISACHLNTPHLLKSLAQCIAIRSNAPKKKWHENSNKSSYGRSHAACKIFWNHLKVFTEKRPCAYRCIHTDEAIKSFNHYTIRLSETEVVLKNVVKTASPLTCWNLKNIDNHILKYKPVNARVAARGNSRVARSSR